MNLLLVPLAWASIRGYPAASASGRCRVRGKDGVHLIDVADVSNG